MDANKNVRAKNPLIHCITNYVTVNDVANCILAVGGSPIMADDEQEVEEIVTISNALVINTGTLNSRTIISMHKAAQLANKKNIPVILDPVGVGASEFRNKTVNNFLSDIKFAAIRGNLSELLFCAGKNASTRGVDVGDFDKKISAREIAKIVADKFNCIAVITGAADVLSDGKNFATVKNGVADMKKITGTGCMLSGILAAYLGANANKFSAAVSAVASIGIAGEISFEQYKNLGTGSLRVGIIDALSKIDDKIIAERGQIFYEH